MALTVRRMLDLIARCGDLAGYRRAEELRAWLYENGNEADRA